MCDVYLYVFFQTEAKNNMKKNNTLLLYVKITV